jgi:hypothetical protein
LYKPPVAAFGKNRIDCGALAAYPRRWWAWQGQTVSNALRFDGGIMDIWQQTLRQNQLDRKIGRECDSLVLVQGNFSSILGGIFPRTYKKQARGTAQG